MFIIAFTERRIKTFGRNFVMKNNFPIWVVKKIFKEEKDKVDNMKTADKNNATVQTDARFERKDKSHLLQLFYQGEKCLYLTKSWKKNLNHS